MVIGDQMVAHSAAKSNLRPPPVLPIAYCTHTVRDENTEYYSFYLFSLINLNMSLSSVGSEFWFWFLLFLLAPI